MLGLFSNLIDVKKFDKKSCLSYFIWQWIQQFNQSVFCDLGILRSVGGGGVSSRSINCSAYLWHGLGQLVNHLYWDGHPLLLSAWNNSSMFAGAFSLPQTQLSNSSQMCLIGFKLILGHGSQGQIWTLLLVRNCVVWHAAWGKVLLC